MSFRDQTSFSMVAGEEKLHKDRIPRIKAHETNVLPISIVLGGNASGKSNFFKALSFAKQLVMNGRIESRLFSVSPFKLDPEFENRETKFSFEIFTEGNLYDFSFTIFRKEIIKEKMSIIHLGKEEVIYERQKSGKFKLNKSLEKRKFVKLISEDISKRELFLYNVIRFGRDESWPVFDWFANSLIPIKPELVIPTRLLDYGEGLLIELNKVLPLVDCGIERIDRVRCDLKLDSMLTSSLQRSTLKSLEEGESIRFNVEETIVTSKDGELVAEELNLIHPSTKGEDVKFDIREESDGTIRILDLLPFFLDLSSPYSSKVYIIDELDRSLHTRLVNELINAFLENCSPKTRSQLIFTAHDVLLMNTDILRRDEMWITRRLDDGSTEMISVGDFSDESEENRIYLDYLQGFLGGLPNVMLGGMDFKTKKGV